MVEDDRAELENEFQLVNESLERELRAKGFEPDQLDRIALPGDLARLYMKRESLRDRLGNYLEQNLVEDLTMREADRIADQFRRAFDGEAWHGPSVMSLLSDVSAEEASSHPIPSAHSIWELVMHIAAWERACKRRLEGDTAQLTDEENFPKVTDTSEQVWERAKSDLVHNHESLVEAICSIDDSRLDQPIISDPSIPFSTTYVTLHGGVQHDLYHAGQIAILKKALKRS